MVMGYAGVEMGQSYVDRWINEFGEDGTVGMIGTRAQADGPFYDMVKGTMKRTDKKAAAFKTANASFGGEMIAAQTTAIGKLSGAIGDYKMKGWWIPAPGAEKMEFTAKESVRAIFGGSVIEMKMSGEPSPDVPAYEGLSWMAWDEHNQHYNVIYANSMGEVNIQQGHKDGNKLIMNIAAMYQGDPTSGRGVVELAEDGSFHVSTGHHMMGAHEPFKVFEGIYEKQ